MFAQIPPERNQSNCSDFPIYAQGVPLGLSGHPIVFLLPTPNGGKTLIGNGIFLTIP
jgi:hypothetical protein